jgi:hypothetical protein
VQNPIVYAGVKTILDLTKQEKLCDKIAAFDANQSNLQGHAMSDAPFRPFDTHLDEGRARTLVLVGGPRDAALLDAVRADGARLRTRLSTDELLALTRGEEG